MKVLFDNTFVFLVIITEITHKTEFNQVRLVEVEYIFIIVHEYLIGQSSYEINSSVSF